MNILIVEDNNIAQMVLKNYIDQVTIDLSKIETFSADNGQQALDFIKNSGHKIDLILSDFHMPVMDALEFSEKFREFDKSTPIVIITANYSQAKESFKKGLVNYFMEKPADINKLKLIILESYIVANENIGHSTNKTAYC